ncbi:Osmotin, thaumatin-like protein [Violaceomyces palustris]|uniref:Osmotin, thaumatin-like protein n=1 Tax=Violaceomyces palustris TaxID=1673888 RepID=A0ACD0NU77_9BASI|nr:Osmotin, thaumatin-like protein [Violaceomyces palustris]
MIKLTKSSILAAIAMAIALPQVSANSNTIRNLCTHPVWVHEFPTEKVYRLDAGQSGNYFLAEGPGVAFNFYTGCQDNTAVVCRTGGTRTDSGQTPFMRAEASWDQNGVNLGYNISPLYGYNMSIKMWTGDTNSAMVCNIQVACPVYGPDMSCYSPCCDKAEGCLGTNNCKDDGNIAHGARGTYTGFYQEVCPDAYSFPDDGWNAGGRIVYLSGQSKDLFIDLCTSDKSTNRQTPKTSRK